MARVIILLLVIFSLLSLHLSQLPNVTVEGATVVALGRVGGGGGRSGGGGGSSRGGGGSSRGGGGSPRRGSGGGRGTAPFLVGAGAGVAAGSGRSHGSSNYSAATQSRCSHAGRTLRIGIIAAVAALLMSY
ncbi:hypothetical protein H6P81_003521 [Aristolochia fimbriata]|uniref:Uncharacterized protein n=1 Tax=Aristolochia fimbriata TaxID=158543 RepID=A0AAV7FDL5_ARIFI|nr:hypothetical protein H6P81_003521 [Aristolochia fimbriata]